MLERLRSLVVGAMLWKVVMPLCLVVASVGLGTHGFRHHHLPDAEPMPWGQAFLMAAGLPILETTNELTPGADVTYTLQTARFLGVVVPPYAFVLALLVAFQVPLKQLHVNLWRWPFTKHVVVCGLGWKGYELIKDMRGKKGRCVGRKKCTVAVIEPDPDNPLADDAAGMGVVLFNDDATSRAALRRAGLSHASKVYVVSGNDEMNCRVVNQLAAVVEDSGRTRPLPCYVDIQDPGLRQYLAEYTDDHNGESRVPLQILCFNIEEVTARVVLREHPVDRFQEGGPRTAHAAVVGSHPMARALLIQLLRTGHFAADRSLEIDVIAENVSEYRAQLYRDMPCLSPAWGRRGRVERMVQDVAVPVINFIELPRSDTELLSDACPIYHGLRDGHIPTIFVCIDHGHESAALIRRMHGKLQSMCAATGTELHIGFYYNYPEDRTRALVMSLQQAEGNPPNLHIFDFGSYEEQCTMEALEGEERDALARQIAAFYRYTYRNAGEDTKKMDREFFREQWRTSAEWERDSNRQAADHIHVKLRHLGLTMENARDKTEGELSQELEENIETLARMEHQRWCAERLLTGWRPLEPAEANVEQWQRKKGLMKACKLHIDLVPFDGLVNGERDKDYDQIYDIPRAIHAAQEDDYTSLVDESDSKDEPAPEKEEDEEERA